MIRPYAFGYSNPFVGQAQEIAEITARLLNPDCRLLIVTGLGGSGKTRLAIEAANITVAQFAHGAVFVPLQPLTLSNLLVPTIAQALGMTFYGDGETHQQLLDYLHNKTLLIILDNFEHVLDSAAFVSDMLAYAPGITVQLFLSHARRVQPHFDLDDEHESMKTHTLTIYRKLEVANRTQAIRRAQELGLLGD